MSGPLSTLSEPRCDVCGLLPRQFPEDPEIWLCRCDTTAQEWQSGHLMTGEAIPFLFNSLGMEQEGTWLAGRHERRRMS